jgi:ubiquinone biosynthesis protein UbiJ
MTMIKEASEHFVEILSHKPALVPLYQNRNMVLELRSHQEQIWLQFSYGCCSLLIEKPEHVDIVVSGENENIASFMKGCERLTLMKEEGRLSVSGNLRNLLSLESLFVLTGESSLLHN